MKGLARALGVVSKGLCRVLEAALIVAVAVLVLDVLWGVFARYVMSDPSHWTEEVAQYLLMWVAMLGTAVAFDRQAHLGLDYLTGKLDPAAQRLNGILAHLLVSTFAALVMVYGGWVLVRQTVAADQRTAALDLAMGHVYLAVPISGIFIIVFALRQMVDLIACGGQDPPTVEQALELASTPALDAPAADAKQRNPDHKATDGC